MKRFKQRLVMVLASIILSGSASAQDFWSNYLQTGTDALKQKPHNLPSFDRWSDLGLNRGTLLAPTVLFSAKPYVFYIRAPASIETTLTTPVLWNDQKVAAVAFSGVLGDLPTGDYSPEANPLILCQDFGENKQVAYMSLDTWVKAAQAFDPTVHYEIKENPTRLLLYHTEAGQLFVRTFEGDRELKYTNVNPVERCYEGAEIQAGRSTGSFSQPAALRETARHVLLRNMPVLDLDDTISVDGALFARYNPGAHGAYEGGLRKTLQMLGNERPFEPIKLAGQSAVKWVVRDNKVYLNVLWSGEVDLGPNIKYFDGAFYYIDALTEMPRDWKITGYVLRAPFPDNIYTLAALSSQWTARENDYITGLWRTALEGAVTVDRALYFRANASIPALQVRFEKEQLFLDDRAVATSPGEIRVIEGERYLSARLLARLGKGPTYDEASNTLTLKHSAGTVTLRLSDTDLLRYTSTALAQRDQAAQEAERLAQRQVEVKAILIEVLGALRGRQEPAILVDGSLYIMDPREWFPPTRTIAPFSPVQGATTQPVSWRHQTYISLELLKAYNLEARLTGNTLTLSHPPTKTSVEAGFDKRGLRVLSLAALQKLWKAETGSPVVLGPIPNSLRTLYSAMLLEKVGLNTYTIRSRNDPGRVLVMTSNSDDKTTRKFCSINGLSNFPVKITRTNSGQYLKVEGASSTGTVYLPVTDIRGQWNKDVPSCLAPGQ